MARAKKEGTTETSTEAPVEETPETAAAEAEEQEAPAPPVPSAYEQALEQGYIGDPSLKRGGE